MTKKMKLRIKLNGSKKEKKVWCVMNKNYFRMLVLTGVGVLMASSFAFANDMDKQIEDTVRNSYVFKNYLSDDSIRVQSKEGLVTLTGEVDQTSEKSLAEDAVENIPGVVGISNQIEINTAPEMEYSDGWIGTKVKTMLLFHRNVSATKTQVDVKEGIVTLSGEADSEVQKDLTEQYTKDIDGVKGVINILKVVVPTQEEDRSLGDKVDDASITAQIKAALLIHRSTSALKTNVHTKDGVVKLEGEARNMAEKDLVTKIVRDIHGVRDVNNQMAIA
jgi:hyperosmotically inducible protein